MIFPGGLRVARDLRRDIGSVKFWALDAGLVLGRIIVDACGLKPSYLGPLESPYFPQKRETAAAT